MAISGIMRSGTSPLALMLHQMGVSMGSHQRFPAPGNEFSSFEWEDAALADQLVQEVLPSKDPTRPSRVIREYVAARKRGAKGKPWGVKTPFLLPFVAELRAACDEAGEDCVLVVTKRNPREARDSLRRQMSHLSVFERGGVRPHVFNLQDALEKCWDAASDGAEIFEIEETLGHPRKVARRLADLAGVKVDADAAIRGFRGGASWV